MLGRETSTAATSAEIIGREDLSARDRECFGMIDGIDFMGGVRNSENGLLGLRFSRLSL